MDRIRAGLTGLAAVFLVTAAAALLFGPDEAEQVKAEQQKEPGEPLAQLGVAPGAEKDDPSAAPGTVEAAPARPPETPTSAPADRGAAAPGPLPADPGAPVAI